jgi:hypothetical protein
MRELECIFHEYNPQTARRIFQQRVRVMAKSEQGVQLTCEQFQRGSTEKPHLEAIQSGIIEKQL